MNFDFNKQYRQDELPGDIFNAGDGDLRDFNGQQVRVKNNGNGTRSLSPLSASERAMNSARQAQQMQIEANKPAIQTLETHKTNLDSKYKELLTSITASEQPAMDSATLAANNELGRRGITGSSGIAQKSIAQAQAPVATQFGQLKANTGLSRERDLGSIAQQIAALQAGNVPGALSYGSGIEGLTLQAQQIANNFQLGKEQNDISRAGSSGGSGERYATLSEGQTLFDLLNNAPAYTAPKSYAPKSGGGNSGW